MGTGIFCCFPDPVDFDADVNLFHFELHRAIGKGAFGKVRVVEHKRTKKLFALKYINKAQCVKQKAVANVIQERQLLEEVDHPFVVNLRYAFQDDANCFFALDLMLGGDLRFHLERKGHIEESAVRFWVAELSCALSYLHKQRIIHRDIKPDNILLDIMGHAHITDFNVAIHYSSTRLHSSVAGSLAYMAPEVCGRKGYSWQADWWSLGVCAYELIFGRRPFEGRSSDSLTAAIVKDHLRFPERAPQIISEEGISALRQFIERNPKKRLGCRADGQNVEGIRSHPWLSSLNWEVLEEKDAQPPFVPDMRKANFDITHELDEFLMVEKPLTATKRKQNLDLDKLAPEYRQLEEQFTNFDYTKPRRMSYYPHNQPIMVPVPHGDGEPSLEITRTSSHSQHSGTLVVGVTTAGSGSRTGSPIHDHAPATQSPLALPVEPDRAVVRTPLNGDGAAPQSGMNVGEALAGPDEVQAVPRRSAGSAMSARSAAPAPAPA
ncbi:kinase-like protein [Fomitiporia mediterranea MF3/22]|uniref:kinase-like protein n=1 Tax=Fomitiporia mediterranea (strain MF3/22) TaxID=694068 RepID=UPI0004407CA0|nr:kinase-like protein [Fomitiporia mediterranea MF3/22]EJD07014.1 kinase-like protein [Fomitiporia mediterranea MF3/22]